MQIHESRGNVRYQVGRIFEHIQDTLREHKPFGGLVRLLRILVAPIAAEPTEAAKHYNDQMTKLRTQWANALRRAASSIAGGSTLSDEELIQQMADQSIPEWVLYQQIEEAWMLLYKAGIVRKIDVPLDGDASDVFERTTGDNADG